MNLGTFKDPQTRKVLKCQDKDGDMQKFIKFNVTLKVYVHKGSLFWVTATTEYVLKFTFYHTSTNYAGYLFYLTSIVCPFLPFLLSTVGRQLGGICHTDKLTYKKWQPVVVR